MHTFHGPWTGELGGGGGGYSRRNSLNNADIVKGNIYRVPRYKVNSSNISFRNRINFSLSRITPILYTRIYVVNNTPSYIRIRFEHGVYGTPTS